MQLTPTIKDIEVRHRGDSYGNGMVLRLTSYRGREIHAIAVPQAWASSTGPTWVYLIDSQGLTLIDAGGPGSFEYLTQGIQRAGFSVRDIERVVITHGHPDHDGTAVQVTTGGGAKLWAHHMYAHLLPYHPWEILGMPDSPVHRELKRVAEAAGRGHTGRSSSHGDYLGWRNGLKVDHKIHDGDRVGDLTFIYAPGHSPDEICISMDGSVFTGDHVLPEITPHPTSKARYPDSIREKLPKEYQDDNEQYGLQVYLRSLKKIMQLDPDTTVLPAHRLFNKNRLNLLTVKRAGEIVEHHLDRLHQIVLGVGQKHMSLREIARGIFSQRNLQGGNLYSALSEVVSHIEVLVDAGDVKVMDDGDVHWQGTENFRQVIQELKP